MSHESEPSFARNQLDMPSQNVRLAVFETAKISFKKFEISPSVSHKMGAHEFIVVCPRFFLLCSKL